MTNLKAYLAHSWRRKNHPDKYRIIKALKERKVVVVDPFEGEEELYAKYGETDYYTNCIYKLGREIWVKDLAQIRDCELFVAWVPNHTNGSMFGVAYELCYAFMNHKFIQIISPRKRVCFAYVLSKGNQQFETIEDFENVRVMRW